MSAYCSCGDLADFRITAPGDTQPENLCGRCATLELAPHATSHQVENVQEDEEHYLRTNVAGTLSKSQHAMIGE